MKTPKFRLRKQDLEKIITDSNVKITWKKTVRDAMRRQFIEDPIEFLDINLNLTSVASNLTTMVVNGDYVVQTPIRILVEKSKGLCRQVVVPHPYDATILQCLSNNLFPFLKNSAPHLNAYYQPDRGFGQNLGNKTGYSGLQAWLDFQKKILEFSKSHPFLVITDVANYYDTISYPQLRNILANYIPDQKEALLDLTLHILGSMLWQPDYMPRVDIGLPQIDLDAPRLLAHTFLYELDRFLSTSKGIDYARFMDDIDIGVDSFDQAKHTLRDIDLVLHSRQVRLNAGKTKILIGPSEIRSHFKVRENLFLNELIDWAEQHPANIARTRKIVRYLWRRWQRYYVFDTGNGEKILKRLLNYSSQIGVLISNRELTSLLRNRPAVREETFRYASRVAGGEKYIPDMIAFIQSTSAVDDAGALLFSYALVEIKLTAVNEYRRAISQTAFWMCDAERSASWIYAGFWLLSKYGTEKQIWDAISKTYKAWQPNYRLGRMVAGFTTVLVKQAIPLENLIRASRNQGAAEVLEFLHRIMLEPKGAMGIMNYLSAPNPSYPNRITHAKWLVLLAVLRSSVTSAAMQSRLRKIHFSAFQDRYYKIKHRAVT